MITDFVKKDSMEIKDKMSVIEVLLLLEVDLLGKTELLNKFVLENYGENTYIVSDVDIKDLYCSEIILKDEFLGDIIKIIRVGNSVKKGQEGIGFYHSSPQYQATASYQFVSSYDEKEWAYRFVDVFDANGETYIQQQGGRFLGDKVIHQNYHAVNVMSKDIEKYRSDNIENLITHIDVNSVKVLSRKKKIY